MTAVIASTSLERPTILAVDDDDRGRSVMRSALSRRFGTDYRVICADGAEAGLSELQRLRDAGRDVALIAASQWLKAETGTVFLGRTRDLYPTARRLVLASHFDRSAMEPIARSSTLGEIDAYESLPWSENDEAFLAAVGVVLADWAIEHHRLGAAIKVIARPDDEQARVLRDVLARWGFPLVYLDAESDDGERVVRDHELGGVLPVVKLTDGRKLAQATVASVAEAFLNGAELPSGAFDVVVLGLGPAGFSAALNAASEGLRVLMVEPSFSPASSSPMIRNYLGFPSGVTGAELLRRAWIQASMFGAQARIGRKATDLRPDGDGYIVVLDDGSEVQTRRIVLATGVQYRRLGIPSVDGLIGRGVFYGYGMTEAQALGGESVAVVGGANSAAQAAVHLSRYADRVCMVVRGDSLAETVSEYLLEQIGWLGNIEVRNSTEIIEAGDKHQLRRLVLRNNRDGSVEEVATRALFILIGSVPRTDWLPASIARDRNGFVLTGTDAPASDGAAYQRLPLETTLPGVFAAGDVRYGSIKRVAAAVGEGAAAIQQLHRQTGANRRLAAAAR